MGLVTGGMAGLCGASRLVGLGLLGVVGCAHMHNVEITDIDSSRGRLEPFEIQVSSTGISVSDGAQIVKALSSDAQTKRNADTAENIAALTQMGPKTGDPTLRDDWADDVSRKILERCPTGQVTGLSAKRETMDYPVISGELVTLKGFCIL